MVYSNEGCLCFKIGKYKSSDIDIFAKFVFGSKDLMRRLKLSLVHHIHISKHLLNNSTSAARHRCVNVKAANNRIGLPRKHRRMKNVFVWSVFAYGSGRHHTTHRPMFANLPARCYRHRAQHHMIQYRQDRSRDQSWVKWIGLELNKFFCFWMSSILIT